MAETKKGDVQLDMTPADTAAEVENLRRRVRELEAKEQVAPSGFVGGAQEVYAGQVPKLDPDGKEIEGEMEDAYFYRIDLPPSGGTDLSINGNKFYHGEQYKIDTDILRTLKDAVFRCWKHEGDIHGSNENFYRRPQERVLRGNGR